MRCAAWSPSGPGEEAISLVAVLRPASPDRAERQRGRRRRNAAWRNFACGLSAQWPGVIVTRIGRPNASAAAWGCVVSPPRDRPMAWASSPLLRGRVGMDLRDRRLDQHPFGSGTGAQCLEKPFPCLGAVHRRNQVRTACQCPGAGGGSRQGEAPRASQRIASVNGRSSAPLRPRAPALPGSSGPVLPVGPPACARVDAKGRKEPPGPMSPCLCAFCMRPWPGAAQALPGGALMVRTGGREFIATWRCSHHPQAMPAKYIENKPLTLPC